jgi:hypothetical protein
MKSDLHSFPEPRFPALVVKVVFFFFILLFLRTRFSVSFVVAPIFSPIF